MRTRDDVKLVPGSADSKRTFSPGPLVAYLSLSLYVSKRREKRRKKGKEGEKKKTGVSSALRALFRPLKASAAFSRVR